MRLLIVYWLKSYFNGFRRFNFFWKLFDEFLKHALTKDKLGDKIKPRCSRTVTFSIML